MPRWIRTWTRCCPAASILALVVLAAAPDARGDDKADPLAGAKAHVLEAARKACEIANADSPTFSAPLETRYFWSVRFMQAQVDFDPTTKLRAIEEHFERMSRLEERYRKMEAVGLAGALDVATASYYRAEARLWLEAARGK